MMGLFCLCGLEGIGGLVLHGRWGAVRTKAFGTGRRGIADTETGKGLRLVRERRFSFLRSRSRRATACDGVRLQMSLCGGRLRSFPCIVRRRAALRPRQFMLASRVHGSMALLLCRYSSLRCSSMRERRNTMISDTFV